MRKLVIALLLSLLTPIVSLSQSTYPIIRTDSLVTITPEQLKITNLIFNEHKFLLEKVDILNNQVSNLEQINTLYEIQDSVRCKEIETYKQAYEDSFKKYNRLDKRYKTYKYISFGSVLLLIGALIW